MLDEFQYLAESSPHLIGRLQRSVDEVLRKDSSLVLVLCGSAVSFTEKELLGYRSPLYGRRAAIRVRPLGPVKVAGFYPGWGLKEVIEAYAVLGGTPAYHELFDPGAGLWENVLANALTQGSYLLDEAVNLLRQEVREPRTYFSNIIGCRRGRAQPGKAGPGRGGRPQDRREVYIAPRGPRHSPQGAPLGRRRPVQVRFADNYFRFWFTFIKPYQGLIEAGMGEEVLDIIKSRWGEYMGAAFEDAVADMVPDLVRAGVIKALPEKYGRWWHRGEEIDLVVVGADAAQFIEVKWGTLTAREARRALDRLRVRAAKTGLTRRRTHYTLIAGELAGAPSLEKDESAYDLRDLGKVLGVGGGT